MISYLTAVSTSIKNLVEEVNKSWPASQDLTLVVDLFREVHGRCRLDRSNMIDGQIVVTFDPKDLDQSEYDMVKSWLIAELC